MAHSGEAEGEWMSFTPVGKLERSLYDALMILVDKYRTGEEKFGVELREANEALVNYHNTHECGGGVDHDWGFVDGCSTCKAPDGDCQNYHTIWCPTCLGCREE
jgi:hypothetical protein